MMVYFGPSEAHSKFLVIQSLALIEKRFSFFWNDEPDCWDQHGLKPKSIAFLTRFDMEGYRLHLYEGSANIGSINKWLIEPLIPPLVRYDESIGETMRKTMKPTVILFRSEDDEFEDYAVEYKMAALANRNKAIFVWADKNNDADGMELAKHMKVHDYKFIDDAGPSWPSIRILWIYKKSRYISQI